MRMLGPLYRLFLRNQLSAGRLVLVAVLSGLGILVGLVMRQSADPAEAVEIAVGFNSVFGLGLMVPVVSLVLASSALGDLVADETLVYLWHRKVPRWVLAAAPWLSAVTFAVPFTAIPLAIAAWLASADTGTAAAVMVSNGLAAIGYSGLFVFLGLTVRRSLVVGLAYVVIWELFVARVGAGAARLSLNTYPSSVLSLMTDIDLPLADRSMTSGVLIPLIVPLVAVALTARRLQRMDVA